MGQDAMILCFLNAELEANYFTLSSFTLIKRFFSSSSLSAIKVVSSAYLRLLIFLQAILIPTCESSSPAFCMMYSAIVQFNHSVMSDSLLPHGLQHARPPCPSPVQELVQTHVHPTVSSSVIPRLLDHNFSSKEKTSLNFMAPVTICSDFGAQEKKVCQFSHGFLIYLSGTGCDDLYFLNVEL